MLVTFDRKMILDAYNFHRLLKTLIKLY